MSWIIVSILLLLVIAEFIIIKLQRKSLDTLIFNFSNVEQYTKDLREVSEDFTQHLESFNKMDTYMGDPIVEDILKHSKFVVERMALIHSSLIVEEENKRKEDGMTIESKKE